MIMRTIGLAFFVFLFSSVLKAQDDLSKLFEQTNQLDEHYPVIATFKSPHIINGQSNETVHKNDLQFIVMHRFGDIAGTSGGMKTFYGLDNSTDILIGFDYGLTDEWSIGTGRTKGSPNGVNTDQKQLYYLNSKYRLMHQTVDNHTPFSVTLFGNSVISGMDISDQNYL